MESTFQECTNIEDHGRRLVVRKYLSAVAFKCILRLLFGKRFMTTGGKVAEQGSEFKEIVAEVH